VLGSLSRLMRKGTGAGRTRADHPALAAQLVAAVAHSAEVADLAELVGAAALTETDRRYLDLAAAFRSVLVSQGPRESRSLEESLARAWQVASVLPKRELTMLPEADVERFYGSADGPGTGTTRPDG